MKDKVSPRLAAHIKGVLSDLCDASLREKWNPESTALLHELCPFCEHAPCDHDGEPRCKDCLCPPEICQEHGLDGAFQDLIHIPEYDGHTPMFTVDPYHVAWMRGLFQRYIIKKEIVNNEG